MVDISDFQNIVLDEKLLSLLELANSERLRIPDYKSGFRALERLDFVNELSDGTDGDGFPRSSGFFRANERGGLYLKLKKHEREIADEQRKWKRRDAARHWIIGVLGIILSIITFVAGVLVENSASVKKWLLSIFK